LDRAIVFVDGSNWYHGCASLGLKNLARLNFAKISRKLVQARQWTATRYYVGQVPQGGIRELAANQRRFLSFLRSCDSRITVHLGRLEPREIPNEAAAELLRYLGALRVRIDPSVYHDLLELARAHSVARVMVEKAVDVRIAVDMVVMAERDEYDTAYLLSADGDLAPAVESVMAAGRRVFVASPGEGARLAAACSAYLRLRRPWFTDVSGP
jgi:uncharacterized LabA/DUF88 family protein